MFASCFARISLFRDNSRYSRAKFLRLYLGLFAPFGQGVFDANTFDQTGKHLRPNGLNSVGWGRFRSTNGLDFSFVDYKQLA